MKTEPLAIERIGPFIYERFSPSMPPVDAQGAELARHRVAIVGGGPVGLATALGLARQGVASVVIEADETVCEGSRAACISRRSLQIVERLGALPRSVRPLPRTHREVGDFEALANRPLEMSRRVSYSWFIPFGVSVSTPMVSK